MSKNSELEISEFFQEGSFRNSFVCSLNFRDLSKFTSRFDVSHSIYLLEKVGIVGWSFGTCRENFGA